MNTAPIQSASDLLLAPGQFLAGRFRLIRPLGEGGIGLVWLAEDEQLDGDRVACKVLRSNLRHQREIVADLKREVLLARKLRHPNVLALHSFWESEEVVFLTMEFVDGTSLAQALEDRGAPFTMETVLPWLSDIAAALDYAHAHNILHRDVKPANMLLGRDETVKLGDFGIARLGHDGSSSTSHETTQGTVYFMSPEQVTGTAGSSRSDLYSLAASAYQLLSGEPPFCEGEIIAQIQVRPPAPIPMLSESANRELLRALSKSPHKRHATCREFVEALESASDASIVLAKRPVGGMRIPENAPTVVLGDFAVETRRTRLGRLLVEQKLISQEDLAESLMKQRDSGEKLGAILVACGHLTELELAEILSRQLCSSMTRLNEAEIDGNVARTLAEADATRFLALPMKRTPYAVVVAMADPLDMEALNHLEDLFSTSIEPLVTTASDVLRAIARVYTIA